MNHDYEVIKNDLISLGIKRGDSLLIHSSFKSMGVVEGGIETLVGAILSVLGDSGNLIAPTLTFLDVSVENPTFDYTKTPSCVGAVSEYIRLRDGAIRSIHPTHSCAVIGKDAEYFVSGHELDRTPIGENSPIYKLQLVGGKILMLGCGTSCNTSVHGIEEKMKVSYLLPKEPSPYKIILPDKEYTIDFYRHHIKQNGFAQRYDRIRQYVDGQYFKEGLIHGAQSFLIDADKLWRAGEKAISRDEFCFVEKII